MKVKILGLFLLIISVQSSYAQQNKTNTSTTSNTNAEQEIFNLSKEKWGWMAERNVDSLNALFSEKLLVTIYMVDVMIRAIIVRKKYSAK